MENIGIKAIAYEIGCASLILAVRKIEKRTDKIMNNGFMNSLLELFLRYNIYSKESLIDY